MPLTIVADTLPIFPEDDAYGLPGGPRYLTDVAVMESGAEQRNAYWLEPLYAWDVGKLAQTPAGAYRLLKFFHGCRGRWRPFRFKDHDDYKSCAPDETPAPDDQSLGAAAAGQTAFQLKKTYVESPYQTSIDIIKPKGSTIRIKVNALEETTGWTVNEGTGIITRSVALAGGETVAWGGEFYRKCRFDIDQLPLNPEALGATSLQVPIVAIP